MTLRGRHRLLAQRRAPRRSRWGSGRRPAASTAVLRDVAEARLRASRPGIDVAGEVAGLVNDPAITPGARSTSPTASFGQGVAVTPIQLATAYAAMVNGGDLVQPHVVGASAARTSRRRAAASVILDAAHPEALVELMKHVLDECRFYANATLVPGYDVGGKTGTAQIWDPKPRTRRPGDWKHNIFNYSFVGFIGREKAPRTVVVASGSTRARRPSPRRATWSCR